MPSPRKAGEEERLRQDAWIGDAVLELYARMLVLQRVGGVDAEMKQRLTCNEFLACLGAPTKMEARIGVLYQEQGLEGAFAFIAAELEPLFNRREANRRS